MSSAYPAPQTIERGGVAVFADAHLGQAEGDADDFLKELEDLRSRDFRTVVLLGDIFHYFIGDRKFETPLVRRVVDGWRRLAKEGLSIRYVEGNRDFFLARSPYAEPFSRYGLTDGLLVGGRPFAFVHGDRINTDDLPYRFWRVLSKNPVSYAVMKVLPGSVARGIVKRTEARLYRSNFKHKARLPESHLREEARQARRAGYERLLIGHFHVGWLSEEEDGIAQILPAWLEERKHAEISPQGELTIVEEASAARAVKRG